MKGRDTFVVIPLIGGVFGYLFWSMRGEPWPPMRIAGACLMIAGFTLWAIARIQLGSSFSMKAKATALVTHGLYSRIRNPIYVFGSCVITGVILFYEKLIYLIVFVVIIPLQIVRARTESRVLEDKFGIDYRNYKARTWF
jgi:protein-S-isoprenylcysteine O-methyltransferase Ste14